MRTIFYQAPFESGVYSTRHLNITIDIEKQKWSAQLINNPEFYYHEVILIVDGGNVVDRIEVTIKPQPTTHIPINPIDEQPTIRTTRVPTTTNRRRQKESLGSKRVKARASSSGCAVW